MASRRFHLQSYHTTMKFVVQSQSTKRRRRTDADVEKPALDEASVNIEHAPANPNGDDYMDHARVHVDKTNPNSSVVFVHAALLESGFVVSGGHGFQFPTNCAVPLIPYTLGDTENGRCVEVRFSVIGMHATVYGRLVGGQDVYRVAMNLDREANELLKTVKDGLCLPLLIDFCVASGIALPSCFMSLPTELKIKIIGRLPGVDLVRVGSTCTELRFLLRFLSSDDDLWKQKYAQEFGNDESSGTSWKAKYVWKIFMVKEGFTMHRGSLRRSTTPGFQKLQKPNPCRPQIPQRRRRTDVDVEKPALDEVSVNIEHAPANPNGDDYMDHARVHVDKPNPNSYVLGQLVVFVHAALLESGFVVSGGHGFQSPTNCVVPLIPYTLGDIENGRCVEVRFSVIGMHATVYGRLVGGRDVYRVAMNLGQLAGLLSSDMDREVLKTVKDGLCLPLLIDFCVASGIALPACFMSLPTELKIKIIGRLPAVVLARVGSTCTELRSLSSDDHLWKQKYAWEFGNVETTGTSWKAKYARRILMFKEQCAWHHRLMTQSRQRFQIEQAKKFGESPVFPATNHLNLIIQEEKFGAPKFLPQI